MRLSSASANLQTISQLSNPQPVRFPKNASPGGFVEVDAFSKINLFLDVLGKRSDGYHDLVSVMQGLLLCDTLKISIGDAKGIYLETNDTKLPTDSTNLVVKAAKMLMNEYSIISSLKIKLTKRIPMGAGLGGGSSDAAATLLGLDYLFNLQIGMDKLLEMGKKLGADVPFCLLVNSGMASTAIAKGIGEKLEPLHNFQKHCVVLACPPIHVSTKEIFGLISEYSTGEMGDTVLYNFFTPITSAKYPIIQELIRALKSEGASDAEMTGTGSTVFAYFADTYQARAACDKLHEKFSTVKFMVTSQI